MSRIAYHSRRAMQEFDAGMAAPSTAASDAHLRLSSLHMAQLNHLQHQMADGGTPADMRRNRSDRSRQGKAAKRVQD